LVTGGLGFIGSHTTVLLIEQGYRVVIVDNLLNSSMICLERIKQILGSKHEGNLVFENEDFTIKERMEVIFDRHKPYGVIHFAAFKAVGESVAKPLYYYQNNVAGTVNLL
jgi:UDP-glucose 4-epimerase